MRQVSPLVASQLHSVAVRYVRRGGSLPPHRISLGWGITPLAAARAGQLSGDGPGSVRDERLCRLEAILFVAREPLSTRKLSQYANLADATEARTLIRQLNDRYDQLGRAFRVEEVAGGYQLLTRPKFAGWVRRLDEVPKELRLSAPALETLAVIAYRQPAGRAEIEAIRGVNCGEILRQLMDRELVRIAGRSDELGRPYLYATTKRFLQLFGLRTLDELPRAAQLQNNHFVSSRTEPSPNSANVSPECSEEESQVTATIRAELAPEELKKLRVGHASVAAPRARDEDDDVNDLDDDEELDDLDDEEDDFEDEEEDFDDVDDEDLDEDEDEDFEDEEWEEVEDEEDEDWDEDEDDDDEDDWDEDEEEEEEDWD